MQAKQDVALGNIRAEMARRGVSQARVASALGLTQQAVSYKLKGRRPMTLDEFAVIADVLGVSPAWLMVEPSVPVVSAS